MSDFEDRMTRNLERMNGNEEAAMYHQFESLITDRGLVSDPDFFLPPNEYDIVGGVADSAGDECALISPLPAEVGSVIEWNQLECKIELAGSFLESCTDLHSGNTASNLSVLRDSFVRAGRNISLMDNTLLVILTPGVVSEEVKQQARAASPRTEILDLDEYNGPSEVLTLDVDFSSLGSAPKLIHAITDTEDHAVYMGVVSGQTLANMYDRFGIPLLDGNVRHFLGEVGPNKGIAQTIIGEPERFCSYNNGLTVVAEDISITNGVLEEAKGITIVNGGQTTVSIFKAMKKGIDLSKVHVPMKLVHILTENVHARKAILESISLYSNTQSKVNDADRMVNIPPHHEIQEVSQYERLFSGGKGWFYERRRGEVRTKELTMEKSEFRSWREQYPDENVIPASEIGIAWNSWWGSPHDGAAGKNKGFLNYHNELTMRLSQRSWNSEQHHKKTIGLWMIYSFTKDHMANNFSGLRSATLPHVLGWFSNLVDNRLDLISLWKDGGLPDSVEKAVKSLAGPVDNHIRNYQDDDQKQWAKKSGCTEEIWSLPVPDDFPADELPMMRDGKDVQGDPAQYVMDIGADKIWVMYRWGKANGILFQGNQMLTDIIIKTVSRNKSPSPKQAQVILSAWNACCAANFDPEQDYPEHQRQR